MKKIILLCSILLSCSNSNDNIAENTDILPLTLGSNWIYDVTEFFPAYRAGVEESREIKEIDSLGYSVVHITRENILGIYHYIYKEDGLYIVNNMSDVLSLKYPLNPNETFTIGNTEITLAKTDTTIEVPAATFSNCYYFIYNFNGVLSQKRFYKVGVGLVQLIAYNLNNGELNQVLKLKSYEIK